MRVCMNEFLSPFSSLLPTTSYYDDASVMTYV